MRSDKKFTVADVIPGQGDLLILRRSVLSTLPRGGIYHA